MPRLKRGDRGSDVESAQRALVKLGYLKHVLDGKEQVDGRFGENTERAVRKFQSVVLGADKPTGVIDDKTWDELLASVAHETDGRDSGRPTEDLDTEPRDASRTGSHPVDYADSAPECYDLTVTFSVDYGLFRAAVAANRSPRPGLHHLSPPCMPTPTQCACDRRGGPLAQRARPLSRGRSRRTLRPGEGRPWQSRRRHPGWPRGDGGCRRARRASPTPRRDNRGRPVVPAASRRPRDLESVAPVVIASWLRAYRTCRVLRRDVTSSALLRTERWRDAVGQETSNCCAISPAGSSFPDSRWRILRRVGSASAWYTACRPIY